MLDSRSGSAEKKRLEKEAEENKAREAKEAKDAAEEEMADKIAGRGSREGKATLRTVREQKAARRRNK